MLIIIFNKLNNNSFLSNNNINTNKKQNNIIPRRSSSLINIKKGKDLTFTANKNFYKLFNENEQKAISTLFHSEEELNNFKQKIGILENRNTTIEKQYIREIKDLKKSVDEKEDQIKYLNSKIRENDVKIKIFQNHSKEQKIMKIHNISPSEKHKEKKLNVDQQLKEFGVVNNLKNKNEKIEKLNDIINNLKEELDKNNIEKCKEKELNDIKKEIGVIEIVDVEKILPINTKKFMVSCLKIVENEVDICIKGKTHTSHRNRNNKSDLGIEVNTGKELNSVKVMKNIRKEKVYSNYGGPSNINNKSSKSSKKNKESYNNINILY